MNITSAKTRTLLNQPTELLIVPIIGSTLPKIFAKSGYQESLDHHIAHKDFTDQAGSSVLFYPHGQNGKAQLSSRVLLVQLGKNKTGQATTILKAAKQTLLKVKSCGILLPKGLEKNLASNLADGLHRLIFQFHDHKTKITDQDKIKLNTATFFSDINIDKQLGNAKSLGQALQTIKSLSHRPANDLTPERLADYSAEIAKTHGFSCKALTETEMTKLGMGGILGVSRGSDEEARLIVLDYNPKAKHTVALVGKGITFDSGGISIKPSKDMHEMKFDMIGGATVLAVLQAASDAKLPVHIVGIIAASENMPSGKAIKPGDVVKTYSGQTVEVLNTDAEGRMVLADGLTYAQRHFKPSLIIDIATLTGSVAAALGNKITGAIGNNEKMNQRYAAAAKVSNEDLHFLPFYPGYNDELKSTVADFTNIGKQRVDGLVSALFLSKFIEKQTPWIHLDIAGTAWNNEGPTGVMLKSLLTFIQTIPKR